MYPVMKVMLIYFVTFALSNHTFLNTEDTIKPRALWFDYSIITAEKYSCEFAISGKINS